MNKYSLQVSIYWIKDRMIRQSIVERIYCSWYCLIFTQHLKGYSIFQVYRLKRHCDFHIITGFNRFCTQYIFLYFNAHQYIKNQRISNSVILSSFEISVCLNKKKIANHMRIRQVSPQLTAVKAMEYLSNYIPLDMKSNYISWHNLR